MSEQSKNLQTAKDFTDAVQSFTASAMAGKLPASAIMALNRYRGKLANIRDTDPKLGKIAESLLALIPMCRQLRQALKAEDDSKAMELGAQLTFKLLLIPGEVAKVYGV